MHIVHAGHSGKEQNVLRRIYLWLNQLYLKGIVFQIVLLSQAGPCKQEHPETTEGGCWKVLQTQLTKDIILRFLISQHCAVYRDGKFQIFQDPAKMGMREPHEPLKLLSLQVTKVIPS